jgi:hexosaminidase
MVDSRREFIKQAGAGLAGLMLVTQRSAGAMSGSPSPADAQAMFPGLIPLPVRIHRVTAPAFLLRNGTEIDISQAGPSGRALADYLTSTSHDRMGLQFAVTHSAGKSSSIKLHLTHQPIHAGPHWQQKEAYELRASAHATGHHIIISASDAHGLFNGIVTLLQLSRRRPDGAWEVPALHIEDWPRFQWRGYMLDVSRHFFDAREVKEIIDAMALLKLNTFHWHLTDDQGWRIDIKKYPLLTSVGAWRAGIGFGLPANASKHYNSQGQYGGFYTQTEIRDVVAYAAQRHITVVPEIEMPGHCYAAVAAYPWLGCTGKPVTIPEKDPWRTRIGYCVSKPEVYTFIHNVLGEVVELFPGEYLHTGGDEVNYSYWEQCSDCLALMRREHLPSMDALQGYFEDRVSKIVTALGKRMITWHDSPRFSPRGMVAMDWRGNTTAVAPQLAQRGHPVIQCPTDYLYFDFLPASTPVQKVYSYNPAKPGFTPSLRPWLLGAQANLWTENVPNLDVVWQRTFPRIFAAAEVFWSQEAQRHWAGFQRRLAGVYTPPPQRD